VQPRVAQPPGGLGNEVDEHGSHSPTRSFPRHEVEGSAPIEDLRGLRDGKARLVPSSAPATSAPRYLVSSARAEDLEMPWSLVRAWSVVVAS